MYVFQQVMVWSFCPCFVHAAVLVIKIGFLPHTLEFKVRNETRLVELTGLERMGNVCSPRTFNETSLPAVDRLLSYKDSGFLQPQLKW